MQLIPDLPFVNIPVEEYLAGGILRELTQRFGPHNGKRSLNDDPPSEHEMNRAREAGAEQGFAALEHDLKRQHELVGGLIKTGFQLKGLVRRER